MFDSLIKLGDKEIRSSNNYLHGINRILTYNTACSTLQYFLSSRLTIMDQKWRKWFILRSIETTVTYFRRHNAVRRIVPILYWSSYIMHTAQQVSTTGRINSWIQSKVKIDNMCYTCIVSRTDGHTLVHLLLNPINTELIMFRTAIINIYISLISNTC